MDIDMDDCYYTYIFTSKKGYREGFTFKDSIKYIGKGLFKYGSEKVLILLRFAETANKEISMTFWNPNDYTIKNTDYETWCVMLKHLDEKNTILITPRGDFKLDNLDEDFINYCLKNYCV